MIPKTHPRYQSLKERHKLIKGYEKGLVAKAGLIAHGRGEAYDYLLGEKTPPEAKKAITAAAQKLVSAKNPVISVNGNTAALCPKEIAKLAKTIPAKIEVNLFYATKQREKKIAEEFEKHGAKILGTKKDAKIPGLGSMRKNVSKQGIYTADTILVPLEDGDRTEALVKMGKTVIAIDLNPMSRTAQKAHISITDNITRAIPLLTKQIEKIKKQKKVQKTVFDNKKNLASVTARIRKNA